MNNLFKTILIYEALAFVLWNIMVRTQSDYEMWLFENIHSTIYTILASILLIATIVYVAKTVGSKIEPPEMLKKDPRDVE
jgi:adenosyl cobinamide kinase/adenosyl cobinamide phosphate guanylyltransferase|tara:strand:+ start:4310 stop:4549 length:240 start_codon:yes stop_codon:yes gene_type:complete